MVMAHWEAILDLSPRERKGGASEPAEKLESAVILRSSGDEESRIASKNSERDPSLRSE
jgi:hypothetical protein